MTAEQIISEIEGLSPEEQAKVVRFAYRLDAERKRPGNVKQVDGARHQTFGVDRRKVCGAGDGGVHVQSHVEQRTTSDQMFESCQRGVAFARDVLAFSGGDRAALMKGELQDGVSHFQRMQRHKKQFGRAKPAILGNGLRRICFTGHQTQDEAAVGVGSHRRDSSRSLAALILDGFSRSTSSRISSIARRRSASSVSVPLAGWRIQRGSPLSVTCTDWPARVMRFTLSGSRTTGRGENVFMLSDSKH